MLSIFWAKIGRKIAVKIPYRKKIHSKFHRDSKNDIKFFLEKKFSKKKSIFTLIFWTFSHPRRPLAENAKYFFGPKMVEKSGTKYLEKKKFFHSNFHRESKNDIKIFFEKNFFLKKISIFFSFFFHFFLKILHFHGPASPNPSKSLRIYWKSFKICAKSFKMIIKMHNFHQNQHLTPYGCEKSWFYIDFHWFSLIFIDFHWFSLIFIDFHWFSESQPFKISLSPRRRPRTPGGRVGRGVMWPKFSSEWCSRPTFYLNFQIWARENFF